MRVNAGDAVRFKHGEKEYWGRVLGHGMQFTAFGATLSNLVYVQTTEHGVMVVQEKNILEVFIPKEKVEFS